MSKNLLFRYIGVFIGLLSVSIGASFFISANIGSEAITVFMQGIMKTTSSNYAFAIVVANSIPVVLLASIKRLDLLSFGSLAVLLIGPLIDFWLASGLFVQPNNFLFQLGFAIIGILSSSFGLGLYIHANVGMSPFEALVVAIHQKLKNVQFFLIKITFDTLFLVFGFLLGGVVGLGTVISVFAFGPVINTFLVAFKKAKLFAV